MDPERLIGQAKNKIPSLGNKIPKKNIVPKILELYLFWPKTRLSFFLFDLVFGQNK